MHFLLSLLITFEQTMDDFLSFLKEIGRFCKFRSDEVYHTSYFSENLQDNATYEDQSRCLCVHMSLYVHLPLSF